MSGVTDQGSGERDELAHVRKLVAQIEEGEAERRVKQTSDPSYEPPYAGSIDSTLYLLNLRACLGGYVPALLASLARKDEALRQIVAQRDALREELRGMLELDGYRPRDGSVNEDWEALILNGARGALYLADHELVVIDDEISRVQTGEAG